MRGALLWASTNPFLAHRLPRYRFMRRAVRRFMPGEEPVDALREGARLQRSGVPTLVTCLGENVDDEGSARAVGRSYGALADRIAEQWLDMELSVKLTHLGLDLDRELAVEQVLALTRRSAGVVWLDMEDSSYVDVTLDVYRRCAEAAPGRVGICLQAYLRRTPTDLTALLETTPHVRLVKGAYREPPEVAFPDKAEVDRAYAALARRLLSARAEGRCGRVGIGTHDGRLIEDAVSAAGELGLGRGDWEVEMLYGIGLPVQARLTRASTPLRVLVSYGRHWFPWYMRRLAERPANVGFVVRQLVFGGTRAPSA